MDLSIIIPVYNKSKLINRYLDSIFKQTSIHSYEMVLIDDGSTDDSVELSHGKYCAYLDADDYWEDGFIEKTVSFLEEHDDCVAVNVAQRHLTISGEHVDSVCYSEYSNPFVLEDFFSFWAAYMHVCAGSVVIRSEVIKQIGGMRTDLRITEDLEF